MTQYIKRTIWIFGITTALIVGCFWTNPLAMIVTLVTLSPLLWCVLDFYFSLPPVVRRDGTPKRKQLRPARYR